MRKRPYHPFSEINNQNKESGYYETAINPTVIQMYCKKCDHWCAKNNHICLEWCSEHK